MQISSKTWIHFFCSRMSTNSFLSSAFWKTGTNRWKFWRLSFQDTLPDPRRPSTPARCPRWSTRTCTSQKFPFTFESWSPKTSPEKSSSTTSADRDLTNNICPFCKLESFNFQPKLLPAVTFWITKWTFKCQVNCFNLNITKNYYLCQRVIKTILK